MKKPNPHEIMHAIETVALSKGIEAERVVEAVEGAIVAAVKKQQNSEEELVCRFNKESGEFEVFALMEVREEVEDPQTQMSLEDAAELIEDPRPGDLLELEREVEDLGRIAAQAAKQFMFQKVRDAERENIYAEYKDRIGEIINGIVKRLERGEVIIDLGRTEAVLPRAEQVRTERYTQGDRIRALIKEVQLVSKGPQIVLSRGDPDFLAKLFAAEVPEIYDGTVQIRICVREPGERAKIAVISRDSHIDPVGACVGMRGSRVQAVIRELHGEKIDIVPYQEDVLALVKSGLSPARINKVEIVDEEQKVMEVHVDDDQLSLAIGRKGQNVRLASKLVGWRIDVKSEKERMKEAKIRMAMHVIAPRTLAQLPGVTEEVADALIEQDLLTITSIADATIAELESIEGIGEELAGEIHGAANEMLDEGYAEPTYQVTDEGEVIEETEEVVEVDAAEAPRPSERTAEGSRTTDLDHARAVLGGDGPEEAAEAGEADEGDAPPVEEAAEAVEIEGEETTGQEEVGADASEESPEEEPAPEEGEDGPVRPVGEVQQPGGDD